MIYVNSVKIHPDCYVFQVGDTQPTPWVQVLPNDATCPFVEWSSDNPSVAAVNPITGFILANSVGTATILATATDGSGCRDSYTVEVVEDLVRITSVALNNYSVTMVEGETLAISPTIAPENATRKIINWSSGNESILTVDENGVMTAHSPGSTGVSGLTTDGSGIYITFSVEVTRVHISSITVSPASIQRTAGRSIFLEATIAPENATHKIVRWTSSDPAVATVNEISGLVRMNSVGTATVYATAQDGSNCVGSCSVTVLPVLVEWIDIDQNDLTMPQGTVRTLTATVSPAATNKELEWISTNPGVASVNADTGEVKAQAQGTATICAVAKDGSNVRNCRTVTVTAPIPVESVYLTSTTLTMSVGETAYVAYLIHPTDACNQEVVWSSSDSEVVAIDAVTGRMTAKKCGVVWIYAKSQENEAISASCRVYCDRYLYELVNTFGFEEEAARLIRALYDKVDAAFPSETLLERAWKCARLLGGLVYNGQSFDEESDKASVKWTNVAGFVFLGSEETYFTQTLGYTSGEYTQIKNAVQQQNSHCSEKKIPDFAHMHISLSARLAYILSKDGIFSNIYTLSSDETVSYLAGWLGDATIAGSGTTSMKNDDYCADLDAENIYRYILQGVPSIVAINMYYTGLTEAHNRAHIFLSYIDYFDVEKKVFYELLRKKMIFELSSAVVHCDFYLVSYYSQLLSDEQYHWNTVKKDYPDTYNFLMSLKDKRSSIGEYQ